LIETTRAALVLVDLQRDFLDTVPLYPAADRLVERVSRLLARCREAGIPVFHIRTVVARDGRNLMPHWRRNGIRRCIEGTAGAEPPPALQSQETERVYTKPFFSAFGNPRLHGDLSQAGIKTLLVAGIHTHACIHATVLDAYQLGYAVKLVTDAIGSYAPLHAELTVSHLAGRACEAVDSGTLFPDLTRPGQALPCAAGCEEFPVLYMDGRWHPASDHDFWEQRDPCDWDRMLGLVPIGRRQDAIQAAKRAAGAQEVWGRRPLDDRLRVLKAWHAALERRRPQFVDLLIREVGKPRRDAEAEYDYALGLLNETVKRAGQEAKVAFPGGAAVRYRPRGVVAVVTPWNNPLALPVGKLAPALAYGNAVVWKPALQSPALVRLQVAALEEAGLPDNCLNVVMGDAETAQFLLHSPEVTAVSFTGSEAAGSQISAVCGQRGIALQAELGGNNPAVVSARCDVEGAARALAMAAFSFSGQRCTAPRRLVVQEDIHARFCGALVDAVRDLVLGDPGSADTRLGPLISRQCQARMRALVEKGLSEGGRLLTGGGIPSTLKRGCWFEPTVFDRLPETSPLVQEEAFGPLLVIQEARDFGHAIALCNHVRQGLRAILYSSDPFEQQRFVDEVHAGVVHINEAASRIAPDMPFLGWKSSGMGLPEHGRWDRDFYTLTQTVYRQRR
jgi:acyl-CoA reductase-like NAD-dependent aldehyde dehydrogenase/nicotinamidase-related amidase